MKKSVVIGIVALSVVILSGCSSTKKQTYTPQELIVRGRCDEAKAIFNASNVNAADSVGNTALHVAAEMNESDMVRFLVNLGANTKCKNRSGDTPLHVAVRNNSFESAKILSAVKGDVFIKDSDGVTALQLILEKGSDWYGMLINGKNAALVDDNGDSILHYFVRIKAEEAVDAWIENNYPLSIRNNDKKLPLHYAWEDPKDSVSARIGAKLVLAKSELARGNLSYFEDGLRTHNMLIRFNDGQTPLHLASIQGHAGVIDYIVHDELSAKSIPTRDLLAAQDISGATPLHEAVRYGNLSEAKMLLESGANVNAPDSIGKTPILLIISGDEQLEVYKTLVEHGAVVTQKDMYGDSVFHVATMSNVSEEVLSFLFDEGAFVNERNKRGTTPLSLAIENGNETHIRFFVEHGADLNAQDQDGNSPLTKALRDSSIEPLKSLIGEENYLQADSQGNTPLHLAVKNDSPIEYIQYLLNIGCGVNDRNKNGESVLHLAVKKNRRDAGELFISKDADIFATNTENDCPLKAAFANGSGTLSWFINDKTLDATDGSGNTPLHYAAEWKLDDGVRYLISRGAEVNPKNANGETPVFSAVKSDSPSIIKILIANGASVEPKNPNGRQPRKFAAPCGSALGRVQLRKNACLARRRC